MKIKRFIFTALGLFLIITVVIAFIQNNKLRTPDTQYTPHDADAAVISYPDVVLEYDTKAIVIQNIELREEKLTLTYYKADIDNLSHSNTMCWLMGEPVLSTTADFEVPLKYEGIIYPAPDEDPLHLYTLTPEQQANAETLYIKAPPIWKVVNQKFESHTPLPDTKRGCFDKNGNFTGDLSDFVIRVNDEDWFRVTGIKRWKGKHYSVHSGNVKAHFLTFEIESCGYNTYLPGTVYLVSNKSHSQSSTIELWYEDTHLFSEGSKGTMTFNVPASVYHRFEDCEFFIRDFSASEICDTVSVVSANR